MRAPGTFLWNELFTSDTQGATSFYSQLLGWQSFTPDGPAPEDPAETGGPPHTIWMMGFNQVGSMRPHPATGAAPLWLPFITVDDVDECAKTAEELGGVVVSEPFDVPNSGRFAILKDPQGAVFGIGHPLQADAR
jgi:uncharacterized protein